jgi:hypothetical protein
MRKSVIAGLALWAAFAAFAGKTHAEVNYPWCVIGDNRGLDCVFSSREQCAQDGRNRGFGGQCIQNPAYKLGQPSIVSGPAAKRAASQAARLSRAVSAGHSTCTGMKSARLSAGDTCLTSAVGYWASCESVCNFNWERCMKTGFWEGAFIHRPVERR